MNPTGDPPDNTNWSGVIEAVTADQPPSSPGPVSLYVLDGSNLQVMIVDRDIYRVLLSNVCHLVLDVDDRKFTGACRVVNWNVLGESRQVLVFSTARDGSFFRS